MVEGITAKVGLATCGLAAGAQQVADAFSKEGVHVWKVGCLGLCHLEPLVEIQKEGYPPVLYSKVDPSKVSLIAKASAAGLIAEGAYAIHGARGNWKGADIIPRLEELPVWKLQTRRVMSNCGVIDPQSIDEYLAVGGYSGFKRALTISPEQVIQEVTRSGLRGRGGAGFPTGKKWALCRNSPNTPRYAICNADEGDPGAFMNRVLLEGDPHRVLEGLMISAYAIGSNQAYVFVRAEKKLAAQRIAQAAEAAKDKGFLGTEIMGTPYSLQVNVALSAGSFVCGEETALIAAIEGKRGMPRARPPFPAQAGLWGKPTNINNVETLGHVATILANGADWFAQVGSEKSKGTKSFCLSGRVALTGAYEIPLGTPARVLVEELGGGAAEGRKIKAVQTGGPSGGCLKAEELDLPLDYETLQQAGSTMGSGGVVVFDETACAVDIAKYFLGFTKSESCGKCVPCREGTYRLHEMLDNFSKGKGKEEDLEKMVYLGQLMREASLCGMGQGASNPVLSLTSKFREEFLQHAREKKCPTGVCPMR